jgi:hypothetical protein
MTTSILVKKSEARAWQARDAATWLGLAASPTFALMAWISAIEASEITICSTGPGMLPFGGMAWMYLLMSLFHVSAWLRLASGRPRPFTRPATPSEGD